MLRWSTLVVAAAALITASCNLSVENPNDPDKLRSLGQPSGLQQLLGGAVRTWVESRENYFVMPLDAQADNYTASWNNAAMRFYSSVGSDCPIRCGWTNSSTAPEAAGGPTVEVLWYGYYNVLVSANAVLNGIQTLHVCFDNDCSVDSTLTQRNKAVARMLQGMALAGIAMIYDQGFVVDETTDLSAPKNLPFKTRQEVRDAAIAKLDQAYTEAGVRTWSTPSSPGATSRPFASSSVASVPGTGMPTKPARLRPERLERTMKIVSVAPRPSRISTPKRSRKPA